VTGQFALKGLERTLLNCFHAPYDLLVVDTFGVRLNRVAGAKTDSPWLEETLYLRPPTVVGRLVFSSLFAFLFYYPFFRNNIPQTRYM
jgi:hypothetical protein